MIEETNSLGFSQLQHSIHTFVEEFSENKKTETHPFLDHLSTPLTFQNITTTNRSVNTSIYEETNIYPKKTTIKQDKTNIIEIYQETRSPILEKSISVGNHTSPPINENIINATNNETQYPETSFKKLYWTENEHSSMTTNTFYSLTQDHESSKYSKILPNSELFNNESLLQYKTTNQIEETSNNKLKTVNPITSTIKTFKNEYIIDNFSTKSFSEVRTSVVDSTDLKFKEVLKSEHITEALETKTSTKENDEKLIQLKTTTEITSKTHVSEENYAESDRVKRIIDLGGGKLQFYSGNEWFVTDKSQIWIFDNSTSQAMNESFFRTSEDKTTNNFNENKRIIEELMDKPQTKDISEQMPFELFSQSILTTTNENEGNFSIKWGGMSLTNEDLVAIFNYNSISSKNISSYPPSSVDNWGYLQWNSIYNLQKRLNLLDKKCFSDRCEYKVDEDDGHSSTMIVYKNGSSSWKDTYIELRESLSNMRNINERTDFSKRVITMPYISNSESFESFMRNTFQQKTESKTKYDSYVWKNNIFNWHEILALQRMIDSTLSNINRIETSMNQLSWENYLEQFRRSKRINYSDRTVYKINYGLELKPLTIFKDGTTEFDNKRVTFSEMSERVKEMTPPQDSVQQSKEVQHVINLNSGKRQFYWNGRWFVTDNTHVWPFEDQTSSLMSDTFFNTPEDKSANKESIKRLLINNGMFESSFHTYEKMPFEIFTESVLRTSTYMKPNSIYQWGKTSLSLSDIIAMLRLSNFKSYKTQPSDYQWGETNWYSIYDRVKQAPQKTVNQIQEYNITDFDGSTNLLQVYKNGTSRYKNVLIDRTESLTSIQNLNTELDLSQNIINYPYNAQNVPFETFLNDVFDEKINKNTTYSSYTWRDYTFSWDMILAIYRVILYRYINNNEKGLSFSDIVLPILKSTKELYPNSTVLNVKYDGNTKPIIIFCNGRTLYDNEELDYKDMIKQLKDAKKSSGLVFRDDWESIRPTEILTGTTATMTEVKTKKITTYISKDGERITENAAVPHNYDWSLLDSEIADNKAHYPINLGATKVLFYMKGLWYITDGTNIWGFYDSLTIDCTTRLVKQMEQTFPDDPELTETAIQRLIDVKTEDDSEDLTVGLVMPFELIAQKFLFFYEHRKDMYIECKYDYKMYSIEGPEDVIAILRLAAYNDFATSHVELNWGEGRKVNWDWLVYELARSQKNKSRYSYTYKFQSGKFEETPDLIIYLNSSSSWKNQEISSNELYKKLTYVNMYQDFSVVQVNKEFKTDDDAFEIFIKKSLERRLNKKQTFSEYIWSDETFSWYELLTCIRYSDIFPNDLKGSAYWKTAIKTISTALSSNFSDKILYTFDTKEGREDIIVYMNESTLAKGIFLTEIQQYIDRYEDG
ncbi:hypothetical protein J6590_047875 [Homalodisca vitripennis]|nr:hypothetical protein J6590_047875 [Homalodisca vitripennis]